MKESKKTCRDDRASQQVDDVENGEDLLELDYSTSDFPIASRLRVGRERALGKEYLCSLMGYKDARTLRKEIEAERRSGAVICFDGDDGGYFVPATVGELRHFVNSMEMRTRTTKASIEAAEELLREVCCDEN